MIRIKNTEQLELPGLESWRQHYTPAKIKILEKSWAGAFREFVLPEIPIHKIMGYYKNFGRPTKELYALSGAVMLQSFYNLTDDETLNELAFNQQWHFALECFNESDQIVSRRTFWTMRQQIVKLSLGNEVFKKATDKIAKIFKVDTSKQRLDSVHVFSNMARMGRAQLMGKTIKKFLTILKRKDSELFESSLSDETKNRYFSKKENNYFGQIKPSEAAQTLKLIAEEMNEILLKFKDNESISTLPSYQLMERVFFEQCEVNEDKVIVKSAKDLKADNVQNPSDPDAGYDPHKGQGYQTQILETYIEKKKVSDDTTADETKKENEIGLTLITDVITESAAMHDSHAVEAVLETLEERDIKCDEILADTLYGGQENVEKAQEKGINLISPVSGKKSSKGFELFEINFKTNKILACPNGIKPNEIRCTKKFVYTAIWKESACENCPFVDKCPTKKVKNVRKLSYSKKELTLHQRRNYEESHEFKEKYRYRSGIEATNSRFISMTGARRSRYRGLPKMKFSQALKALAINIFRTTRYMRAKEILFYLINLFGFLDLFRASKMKNKDFLSFNY